MALEDRLVHAHPNGYTGLRNPNINKRIVIHSTRSGVTHSGWTQGLEMNATTNWFQSPNSNVATHLVISPAEIVRCLHDAEKGHHAGTYIWNESFGIELTQPTIDTPYEQGHYDNLRKAFEYLENKGYSLAHATSVLDWLNNGGIIFHEELTTAKSDPGYQFELVKALPERGDEMSSEEYDELKAEIETLKTKQTQLGEAGHKRGVRINHHLDQHIRNKNNTEDYTDPWGEIGV
jgi:hypothetical protein